ncbi:MAG: hypothetical protein QG567_2456 [Campylobacterota bacterium]|nr:hypothetical protein [Campylobacterota bacterium]
MVMHNSKILIFNDDIIASVQKRRLGRRGFLVDHTTEKEEAIKLFEKNSYDFVVANFSILNAQEVLNHITQKKPKQRIIVVSTVEGCTDLNGCNHCLQNHKKHRLMMPNDLQKLDVVLNDFDNFVCSYANSINPF